MKWRQALLALCVLFWAAAAHAESDLARINRLVDEETKRLREVSAREQDLKGTLAKYEALINELREQEGQANSSLLEAERAESAAARSLEGTEAQARDLAALSRTRFRILYMRRREAPLAELLLAKSGGSFAENAYYLGKIRAHDRMTLENLGVLRKELKSKRGALEGLRGKNLELRNRIAKNRAAVEEEVESRKLILEELKQQQELSRESIRVLKEQAAALESVVSSLTGGAPREKTEPETVSVPFVGKGLQLERGKLSPPVTGKLLKRFGKQRVEEFRDFIMSKGLEYAASSKEVRAVAEGKVIFTGRMPGYGTVLILDHGERYYSLYGRLSELLVGPDAVLKKGEVFAALEKEEKGQSNFYFEIRKNGVPVNPLSYLKK